MNNVKKTKIYAYVIVVIVVIAVLVIGCLLFTNFSRHYMLCDDYRYKVLGNLFGNPMNIHCVDYDYLAPKFKNIISKDEYNSLSNDEDILEVYKKFSMVNDSKSPTTSISTVGFRKYAGGRVTINNVEYSVISYIDFQVKFDKFQIVRWYVDIIEVLPNPNEV